MKCFRYFSFALFALLGVFFGSFILNQNDTFALEDLVINSPFSNVDVCSNSSSSLPNCGYHYIISSCSGLSVSYSDGYVQPYINYGSVGANIRIYPFFNSVLDFSNDPIKSFRIGSVNGFPSDYNCSITLTDNSPFSGITPSGSLDITENGTYDVSQYAEAVVNVPETDCPSARRRRECPAC